MATYRYNVVVDVQINASGASGAKATGGLSAIEQEAKRVGQAATRALNDSYLQQQRDLTAHNARMSQLATERRNATIADFNDQRAQYTRNIQRQYDEAQRIEGQAIERNAAAAAEKQRRSLVRYFQQAGLSNDPAAINAQTQRNATVQSNLRAFASKEVEDGMANISRIVNDQKFTDGFRKISAEATNANRSLGLFTQAFKGAFIGALTGFAVRATLGNLESIVGAIEKAGVESVNAAARFQTSTNALAVFTGSTASARSELLGLDTVARNTVGLRMEDAEQGAVRLRALGFEAKTVQNLVVGLAKQRLISGVDDEGAIQKVIVNLQQLRAGSPQVQRDIQQMILALPSLSVEIQRAFGSVERFKSALRRDPQAALDKFAEQLAKAQAPAGGLTNAIEKLEDAAIAAGRKFGEPIIDPLTKDIINLTEWVDRNADRWASWGQAVADAIQGASDVWRGFRELFPEPSNDPVASTLTRIALGVGTAGISEGLIQLQNAGKQAREQAEAAAAPFAERFRPGDLNRDFTVNFNRPGIFQTDAQREATAQADQARRTAAQQAENARIQDLKSEELYAKEDIAINRSRYSTKLAQLDSYVRNNTQEELEFTRNQGRLQQQELREELSLTRRSFDERIRLNAGNEDEIEKLQSERRIAVADINEKIAANEYRTQKQIQEQEKRILTERRQALIEFKNLQIQEVQQAASAATTQIERQITDTGTGFDELIRIVTDSNNEIARLTRERFQTQLQDTALTAEQRINIEKEMNLELLKIATDTADKGIEINKRRIEEQKRQIQEFSDFTVSRIQTTGSFVSGALGFIFGPGATSARSGQLLQSLTNAPEDQADQLRRQIADSQQRRTALGGSRPLDPQNRFDANNPNFAESMGLKAQEDIWQGEIDNLRKVKNDLLPLMEEIRAAVDKFQATPEGLDAFDADQILRRQRAETDAAEKQIRTQQQIVELSKPGIEQTREQLKLDQMTDEARVLAIKHLQEQEDQYRQSIVALEAYNKALAEGDAIATANAQRTAIKSRETQEGGLRQNLFNLAEIIKNGGTIDALRIQEGVLQNIVDLRNQEVEAVIAIDEAQRAINQQSVYSQNRADAAVDRFLATQKGITEIVSDTKINLLTTAYSGLEAVADRLTRKFGAFRDVMRELLAGLLKFVANKFLGPLFGSGGLFGGGGGSASGGGGGGGIFSGLFGGGGGGGGGGGALCPCRRCSAEMPGAEYSTLVSGVMLLVVVVELEAYRFCRTASQPLTSSAVLLAAVVCWVLARRNPRLWAALSALAAWGSGPWLPFCFRSLAALWALPLAARRRPGVSLAGSAAVFWAPLSGSGLSGSLLPALPFSEPWPLHWPYSVLWPRLPARRSWSGRTFSGVMRPESETSGPAIRR
jgi:hypothetical protein